MARFLALLTTLALLVGAAPAPRASATADCTFVLGFKALHDLIPTIVGDCVDRETHNPENGDGLQRTTAHHGRGGLLVWRKADNVTAFTDGERTWLLGPYGLQSRPNGGCLEWEACSGARRPVVAVSADEVVRGDPARPWVNLVFNAGAGYAVAPEILDTLRDRGVRTTFYLMGWWAEQNPAIVRRIAAEGHEIASHGYRIFDLTQSSDAEVAADLEQADRVIGGITGRSTRPLWSASAGYRDRRVREIAARLGYRPIFWTTDGGDWRTDSTADGVRRRVLAGAENGAIIVLHFDSPRSADSIAPALGGIIDAIRARGLRLVTTSELVTGELRGS